MLYQELHGLAERHLHRGGAGLGLSTTTLLHEAYLNIAARDSLAFPDRARFLAYASRAMRGLVIDFARRRRAIKRGQEFEITLTENAASAPGSENVESLADLGEALDELGKVDAALSELVDLHFFCGLSLGEIASVRNVSERTVQRDWRKARLLLHHQLGDAPSS